MVKIACVLLTFNEEADIGECLKHLRPYVDYILVLDAGSDDVTVEIAKGIADAVFVKEHSEDFGADKNYAWSLIPADCDWVLWTDSDEKWDSDFLINMKNKVVEAEESGVHVFRFPRVNLPDCKDWPDYQLRFVKNDPSEFEWRGKVDEVLWWKSQNVPLDQGDREDREKRIGVGLANEHPIIHLQRLDHKRRKWW